MIRLVAPPADGEHDRVIFQSEAVASHVRLLHEDSRADAELDVLLTHLNPGTAPEDDVELLLARRLHVVLDDGVALASGAKGIHPEGPDVEPAAHWDPLKPPPLIGTGSSSKIEIVREDPLAATF